VLTTGAITRRVERKSVGRILFTYIVPFLTPIGLYALWIWYRTRYAEKHGGEAPRFEQVPWPLLLFAGAVFALGVLGISAAMQGNDPSEGVYVAPRVEGGKVIPGHIEPHKKPAP
jgi:hypothetical protein